MEEAGETAVLGGEAPSRARLRLRPASGWASCALPALAWFVTTAGCLLTGGSHSPFVALYFPLLVHVATAHPPDVLVRLAAVTVTGYTAMSLGAVAVSDTGDVATDAVVGTALVLTAGLSVRSARDHWHQLAEQTALARVDGLTGCLNQRAFREVLDGEVARAERFGHPLTLVLVDLDRFKDVNDRRGHQAGDEVLANMGHLLRTSVRAIDVVGRIGGDEFAVLLLETGPRDAGRIADRILERARAGAGETTTTVSVGVASLTEGATATLLVADADVALYAAKRAGRDGVRVHAED